MYLAFRSVHQEYQPFDAPPLPRCARGVTTNWASQVGMFSMKLNLSPKKAGWAQAIRGIKKEADPSSTLAQLKRNSWTSLSPGLAQLEDPRKMGVHIRSHQIISLVGLNLDCAFFLMKGNIWLYDQEEPSASLNASPVGLHYISLASDRTRWYR
ncbi:hypothetical protein DFH07DRAFT_763918 [Mycena maculata]|uniref:Uncharacterized protein n=1 Tax=Mycena maculata TaxID=230809 RepID=A0AAD7P2K7_9AGAR|nr:hypothetical protein DFH07DRAFT_763918 [Mycena maculata]